MAEPGHGKTVCVTGASGFIASWLVKLLLERGYTVKGTVRSLETAEYLMQLPGASERLQLVKADLLTPGSFDEVVQGCDGVFHTASPVPAKNVADPQRQLLDPAIDGTINVLKSCTKVKGLKRIVLTSSTAAVMFLPDWDPDVALDESNWSDADYIRETKELDGLLRWYPLSKTLAERAAWDFTKQHNLDMVVVNPGWVFGPVLNDTLSTSNQVILNVLNGITKLYPSYMRLSSVCGVEDVAMAHVLANENPEAEGRYICCERVAHFSDLISMLTKLVPERHIEAKEADDNPPPFVAYKHSSEKIKKLGLTFQPIEDVFRESVASFKQFKLLA